MVDHDTPGGWDRVDAQALGLVLARAVAANTPTSGPWSEEEIRIDVLHAAGQVRLWHAQEARGVPASRRLGLPRLPSWKAFAERWNMPTTTAARRLRAACESLGIADDANPKWFAGGSPVVRPWCDGGSLPVGPTPNIKSKRFVGGVRVVRQWCGRGITRGPKSYQEIQEDQKEHIDARPALVSVSTPEPAPEPPPAPAPEKPTRKAKAPAVVHPDVAEAWAAYRKHHPRAGESPPKGWGVADRVRDHGKEAVIGVVEWAHTSSHKRAAFLREGGYTGETLFRPGKFGEYVDLAGRSGPARVSAMPEVDAAEAAWAAVLAGPAHLCDEPHDLRTVTAAADAHGWSDAAAEAWLAGRDAEAREAFLLAHRQGRLASDSGHATDPERLQSPSDDALPF